LNSSELNLYLPKPLSIALIRVKFIFFLTTSFFSEAFCFKKLLTITKGLFRSDSSKEYCSLKNFEVLAVLLLNLEEVEYFR
jgi:hypothetical protein